ncbi:MAG: hypothetical protein JSS83_07925 [Cyanobacteria bacterium SZAS LIN-3]|nr:hypothetical protein [Cyanobacteria bacterium SZAS LIN-3]
MATSVTKFYPRLASHAAMLLVCATFTVAGASAQAGFVKNKPGDLPDSSQFYMSRRQIQYVDDSPIVKYGNGAGPASGTPGGFGGMPAGGQMALPRAGFQSYTSSAPSITTPLPKVNNGVPPKAPPVDEAALRAKANALAKAQAKAAKAAAAANKPAAPVGIKAYNSFKGYNPAASPGTVGESGASSSTSTNVKGSVLHWSRRRHAE